MNVSNFNISAYQKLPQIVLGFHGCDRAIAESVLNSTTKHLLPSKNEYDWLGNGIYFWLNDPIRAYEWAVETHNRNAEKVKEPYVIGAIIDLGLCLDLCERESIKSLQLAYDSLKEKSKIAGYTIKKNKAPDKGGFNLIRPLDCAVIEHLHVESEKEGVSYDTVRGYFQEGADAYNGAGIKEKSHIQICVRNTECIKGYFLPRENSLDTL